MDQKNLDAYKAVLQIENQKQSLKEKESYWKAYLWSVLLPPLGIYYFLKYFFFGDVSYDSRKAGVISLVLTVVSLIINVWFIQLFFSQTIGENGNLETIKELITPENPKNLQQLLQ